jgi:hypothetical protein
MIWQPIETAPKDGTTIDLWDGHYKHRVVNAQWKHHYWMNGVPIREKSWGSNDRDGPFCDKPTHWMPLPKSPEEGMNKATGGPAYPTYFTADHAISMTLRDYFAGQVLAKLAGTTATVGYCYELADAMLKEREK